MRPFHAHTAEFPLDRKLVHTLAVERNDPSTLRSMLGASLISATELACLEAAGLGALGTRLMQQRDHARQEERAARRRAKGVVRRSDRGRHRGHACVRWLPADGRPLTRQPPFFVAIKCASK
jgi:hypothetical protein